MKITLRELRSMVGAAVNEAKKKKGLEEKEVRVDAHVRDRNQDYSAPLGELNLYRSQGAANFGPMTAPGPTINDDPKGTKRNESALRAAIRSMVSEQLQPATTSEWAALAPPPRPAPKGIWEAAYRYYDFQRRGLGQVREEVIPEDNVAEKKIGFNKLKAKLAHKKGVKNPGALAASIGRKKLGKAGMAAKSAAGRK